MKTKIFLLLALFVSSVYAKELDRRASWQAKFQVAENGVVIKAIDEKSPLAQAGLQPKDTIVSVSGRTIHSVEDWYDMTDALVGSKKYEITFTRNFKAHSKTVVFESIPKEKHKGIETIYSQLTNDSGVTQRLIITKPQNVKNKIPAILFLQGLSCSSVELIPNRSNGYTQLINDIVSKSDMLVLRIEKPGMGDSEGECSKTDFKTELNGYELAAQYLKTLPNVDTEKLIVYGNSMGSALAPYIANKYGYSAVISDGTFVKSWFEHMLEIERRILSFKGLDQSEINKKMNQSYIPLYYGMLIGKKTYQQVVDNYPAIGQDNYHGSAHMYGRPLSFYHQLQDFDVAGEWQKLKVPARIRWGTNDWIMSEFDNDLIIEILKSAGHENHILHKQEGLDHWQTLHDSAKNSFDGKKGVVNDKINNVIIKWLHDLK